MRVDNLQANDVITEGGERVYSPNNKPSASDIGALPATGKAAAAISADRAGTAGALIAVDDRDVKPSTTGIGTNSKAVKAFFVANTTFPDSNRPLGSYSDLLVLDTYGDSSGGVVNAIAASKGANRLYHVQGTFMGNAWGSAHDIYTSANKPTAADVGAHPASWKPTWNDVASKPAQATRWPSWGEVTGKPSTMPPSSHTHPWSQITGQPVYTQRWPNWNEVSGKPGDLLTQATADTRYLGKNEKPDAKTLGGQVPNFYRSGESTEQLTINVGGDANTYYPVVITGTAYFAWSRFSISRGYSEPAPTTWNNATHKGGLTFTWEASGDIGWGGNDHNYRVLEFVETYSTMVAGMVLSTSGMIVWLRGGNARYHVLGPNGVAQNATVYIGTYKSSDGKSWPPRTDNSARVAEIFNRQCIRENGQVFDTGQRVYSPLNKPSAGDVGAYSKSESDGKYVRFDYSGSASYARMIDPIGGYLRSPSSGFLPYSNGSSYLGTNSWRWKEVHANAVYDSGNRVYSPSNKPTPANLGAEPALPADRKRKITYGTAAPTGGSDGDIYIQY